MKAVVYKGKNKVAVEEVFTNACLSANPEAPSAGYGYAGMGPYRGGQAEFLRVRFADTSPCPWERYRPAQSRLRTG